MKIRKLIWFRRSSQTFCLVVFIFLLIKSQLPQNLYVDYSSSFAQDSDIRLNLPVTFFFKLDPLIGISSLISKHILIKGFLWGFLILLITILFGRVFCSFICPFGTIHNAISYFKPSLTGNKLLKANQISPMFKVKYFCLIVLFISSIFGLNLTGFLDPLSLLFRSLAASILPSIGIGIRSLFDAMASSDIKIINLLSYSSELIFAPIFGYSNQIFQTAWFIGLLFIIIIFLNRIHPRFWCRVICPLGALLGIFSKFSILRLEKDLQKCSKCNLCTKQCQGAAEPMPYKDWLQTECLKCYNCTSICPENALEFKFKYKSFFNFKSEKKIDLIRRNAFSAIFLGISLPFLSKLDGRSEIFLDYRLIRPPGSLPENEFLRLCIRCGMCMKVCPTNAINPAFGEAGIEGIWTPMLTMTNGYCEYTCTLCSSVCPTGAIKNITAKDKIKDVKIGSAYLDRGRCLPWSGNAPCIVCQEHCPTSPKAIYIKEDIIIKADGKKQTVQLPYVDLKRCTGCGICENKCPIRAFPAIKVISAGESRSLRNQIIL